MPAPPLRPTAYHWRDVEGTPIPLLCRVEQIPVRSEQGAMPSWLHQHGQVLCGDTHWLPVCFNEDHRLVILRAHLVRVLKQAPGGD